MTEHQTCWQILDIEPIRDKKAIKKAYAKKLKVTRPDADPEGFKRLNTAYQECLVYLDYDWYWEEYDEDEDDDWEEQLETTERENISVSSETHHDDDMLVSATDEGGIAEVSLDSVSDHMNESLKPAPVATAASVSNLSSGSQRTTNIHADIETQPIAQQNPSAGAHNTSDNDDHHGNQETRLDDEFDMEPLLKPFADARVHQDDVYVNASDNQQQFIHQLDELFANPEKLNNLDIWHELLQDDALYDIGFKQQASMDVLGRILDMRSKQITHAEENKTKLPPSFMSQPLLVKLSDFFGWMHNQDRLENQFYYQYDALNQIYDDMEPDDAPVISATEKVSDSEARANRLGLASLPMRLLALVIDIGLLVASSHVFHFIDSYVVIPVELCVMMLWFIQLVLQASPWRATIGQRICGLQLVTLYNERVEFMKVLTRHFTMLFILFIALFSLFKMFGFVIWGAYFLYKHRNNSRFTWLDDDSETCVIYAEKNN